MVYNSGYCQWPMGVIWKFQIRTCSLQCLVINIPGMTTCYSSERFVFNLPLLLVSYRMVSIGAVTRFITSPSSAYKPECD